MISAPMTGTTTVNQPSGESASCRSEVTGPKIGYVRREPDQLEQKETGDHAADADQDSDRGNHQNARIGREIAEPGHLSLCELVGGGIGVTHDAL